MLLLRRSPEQEVALRQLLDNQQVKSSPRYHQWLTPEDFGQQFGPSDSDIQTLKSWLLSHGFIVNHVSAAKTIIEFSGNAGQIRSAFTTEMHKYLVNGEEHWANANDPTIPTALAPVIAGLVSLNNFEARTMAKRISRKDQRGQDGSTTPLFTAANKTIYAVSPYDFATIYNSLPLWNATPSIDGTGQTIALTERSDICTANSPDFGASQPCGTRDDIQTFRSYFGLPTNLPGGGQPVVVIVNGPNPGISEPSNSDETAPDNEREAILDAEIAGGVARNAQIDLVVSQTTEVTDGAALSAEYIVDNNLAPIMSVSFLECDASVGITYDTLWEQAAAQGITVAVSAGDSGSAGCDPKTAMTASKGLAVNGIASTPFNVAVGGTDFNDAGKQSTFWASLNNPVTKASALSYIPEVPWNNSCAANGLTSCSSMSPSSSSLNIEAGGGGQSPCSSASSKPYCLKPSWQSGPAVTGFESTDGVRDIPDVSLFSSSGSSSGSSYVICISDANSNDAPCPPFFFDGGTSASSPAFAGIMAMVNQYMVTQGDTSRQGNANYALYSLANQQITAGTDCASSNVGSGNACTFYDVTTGNNSVPCAGGTPNCSAATNGTVGALVDQNGNLAWNAGPGYDLATGLGTINVTNLVHRWPAAVGDFKPTGTTLQLCTGTPPACVSGGSASTLTLVHGSDVGVNIAVSPVSQSMGIPTGDAALIGTPNTLNGGSPTSGANSFAQTQGTFFTLVAGSASEQTKTLIGGSYEIAAHYTGDGTFGASDSLPLRINVTPESSMTSVILFSAPGAASAASLGSGSSLQYGTPVLVHASVSPVNSDQTSGTGATGSVEITDMGVALDTGSFALYSGGYSEAQTGIGTIPVLPVGPHSFQASYSGDNKYGPSQSSGAVTLIVSPAATSLAVTSSTTTAFSGRPLLLTATLTTNSVGAMPTGTVTFSANGAPISVMPTYKSKPGFQPDVHQGEVTASLIATLSYVPTTTTTITASYSGDNNYGSSSGTESTQIAVVPYLISSPNSSLSSEVIISAVGQTGTSPISIQMGSNMTSVALLCTISPVVSIDAPTCAFSPSTVKGSSTAQLSLQTTAASSSIPVGIFRLDHRNLWFACFLLAILPFILFHSRAMRQYRPALFVLIALTAATAMIACGKKTVGASGSGTPLGVYTVTVFGSPGGSPPISVYFNVE
jgi:hypothetical protein